MDLHMELERRIAKFKNVEACVVFQSGFAANAGTVSADPDAGRPHHFGRAEPRQHHRRLPVVARPRFTSSRTRTTRRRRRILAELLDGVPGRKLLITDGVFSMDGDIGPLPELVEHAEKHGAIMMVDDAHSSGVLGRNGRGTIDHFGLHGRVDIQVGTLSKAIGVLGGYVCGTKDSDRVSLSPGAPLPVFDVASAVGGGLVHRGFRHSGRGARAHRAAVENTRYFKKAAGGGRVRYGHQRDARSRR